MRRMWVDDPDALFLPIWIPGIFGRQLSRTVPGHRSLSVPQVRFPLASRIDNSDDAVGHPGLRVGGQVDGPILKSVAPRRKAV